MRTSIALSFLAAAIGSVNAHGYLASFISGGVTYPGWAPFSDPYITPAPVRVERRISDNGPVTDVSHVNITCNKGGNVPTTAYANVAAGSTVTFQWDQWGSSHSGPVMTCNVWVKIDHWGWDKTATPPWGSDRLAAQGAKWDVKIPATIAPGEYILRHEILGLHVAATVGGAQFIKLTGSGTKALPTGIALPGAYKATES
ncbi:hypothetical protein RhiTH_004390 [Rhizoctonia solani]